jgi:hypothetical protein
LWISGIRIFRLSEKGRRSIFCINLIPHLLLFRLIPLPIAIGTLLLEFLDLIPLPIAIGTLLLEEKGCKNLIFNSLSPSPSGEGLG